NPENRVRHSAALLDPRIAGRALQIDRPVPRCVRIREGDPCMPEVRLRQAPRTYADNRRLPFLRLTPPRGIGKRKGDSGWLLGRSKSTEGGARSRRRDRRHFFPKQYSFPSVVPITRQPSLTAGEPTMPRPSFS